MIDARKIRLAPVAIAALAAFALLKAAGLWLHFAAAEAQDVAPPSPIVSAARPSETEKRLVAQLDARSKELDARAAELDTREKVLEAAELRLEAAINALQEEKSAFARTAGERRDEIGVLSSAYERMKPRDAARIFEVLEDDILIPVAAGMRTQALAGVLAEMVPEKAKALTIALASREAAATPGPQ
jgi:flagellar motility protein MotE (MotC chaperone)